MKSHSGFVVWLTGLSGAGKSTLANLIARRLSNERHVIVLDGDEIRAGLCCDLGYTDKDRKENIRRISEVAKLCADSGAIVLVAVISPFRHDRSEARAKIKNQRFMEVFCNCPIEICKERDVKGFYRRALAGEIKNFTGISSSYEAPTEPDLVLNTADSLDQCVLTMMNALVTRGVGVYR